MGGETTTTPTLAPPAAPGRLRTVCAVPVQVAPLSAGLHLSVSAETLRRRLAEKEGDSWDYFTDLERELLSAFESLQAAYEKQHQEWQSAYESLQAMFEATKRDNAALSLQVQRLSRQVNDLSEKVQRWTPEGTRR